MWRCPHCECETDDGFQICWNCRAVAGHPMNEVTGRERFIVTTTQSIDTHDIVEVFCPVFGESIRGTSFFQDWASAFTDFQGGRSSAYEDVLEQGRVEAIQEMTRRAERLGANAIVGLDIKYESIPGKMFMICVLGTAVRVRPKDCHALVSEDSENTEESSRDL